MCERQRAGIGRIGTLVIDAAGDVVPQDWQMVLGGALAGLPETGVPVLDGTLCGWTMDELHAVAHGTPCVLPGCAIAERLAREKRPAR